MLLFYRTDLSWEIITKPLAKSPWLANTPSSNKYFIVLTNPGSNPKVSTDIPVNPVILVLNKEEERQIDVSAAFQHNFSPIIIPHVI